jgi:hypothetical protein
VAQLLMTVTLSALAAELVMNCLRERRDRAGAALGRRMLAAIIMVSNSCRPVSTGRRLTPALQFLAPPQALPHLQQMTKVAAATAAEAAAGAAMEIPGLREKSRLGSHLKQQQERRGRRETPATGSMQTATCDAGSGVE